MPQLIAALLIALAGFGSAWQIQQWRLDARELEHVTQINTAQRQAFDSAVERERVVAKAQNAAARRAADLRVSADGARIAVVSLHDASAAALLAGSASLSACTERAAAFSELLGAMAAAGGAVSEKADRHASDAQTLIDAWPK
jgi:hypothetical protein